MPETVIIGCLSHYAPVLSFQRDRGIATGILNRVRTARMRLVKTIALSIRIAGEAVGLLMQGSLKPALNVAMKVISHRDAKIRGAIIASFRGIERPNAKKSYCVAFVWRPNILFRAAPF